MDENALQRITNDAIRFVSQNPPELVSIERKKNLLKAKILAKTTRGSRENLARRPSKVGRKSSPRKKDPALAAAVRAIWSTMT